MSVVERLKQLTVKHLAIFGLLLLSAVALTVIGASLLKIINQLSGWIYVGLSVVVFLSLVVVFISPNYIEANVPGFGPVSVDGSNSAPQKQEENVVDRDNPHPEDFEEYAELTREVSPELSTQLFQIQQAGYSDPFEATSAIISEGIGADDRNPVQETIDILESDLEARDFILNSENHNMTVVDIDGERVIAKVDDDQHPPKPGLEFKLFANAAVDVEGTTETFPERVGTVRVEEVDDPLCVMTAVSWDEKLSGDPAQRSSDLTQRGAWVEIGLEEAESIDWDTMEEAYQKLKTLQEQGESNHDN
jgi:hypothetical protein